MKFTVTHDQDFEVFYFGSQLEGVGLGLYL